MTQFSLAARITGTQERTSKVAEKADISTAQKDLDKHCCDGSFPVLSQSDTDNHHHTH